MQILALDSEHLISLASLAISSLPLFSSNSQKHKRIIGGVLRGIVQLEPVTHEVCHRSPRSSASFRSLTMHRQLSADWAHS